MTKKEKAVIAQRAANATYVRDEDREKLRINLERTAKAVRKMLKPAMKYIKSHGA